MTTTDEKNAIMKIILFVALISSVITGLALILIYKCLENKKLQKSLKEKKLKLRSMNLETISDNGGDASSTKKKVLKNSTDRGNRKGNSDLKRGNIIGKFMKNPYCNNEKNETLGTNKMEQ
jgi:hypothetical protein